MQQNQDLKKGQAKPPLARNTWLLIQPPSGPARNDTRFGMSSGRPSRSSGFIFFSSSIRASLLPFRNKVRSHLARRHPIDRRAIHRSEENSARDFDSLAI